MGVALEMCWSSGEQWWAVMSSGGQCLQYIHRLYIALHGAFQIIYLLWGTFIGLGANTINTYVLAKLAKAKDDVYSCAIPHNSFIKVNL